MPSVTRPPDTRLTTTVIPSPITIFSPTRRLRINTGSSLVDCLAESENPFQPFRCSILATRVPRLISNLAVGKKQPQGNVKKGLTEKRPNRSLPRPSKVSSQIETLVSI